MRINAIVDDHIAVAVALVFAKLSSKGGRGGESALIDKNSNPKNEVQRLKSMNYGRNVRNIEIYVKFSGILCQKLCFQNFCPCFGELRSRKKFSETKY